MHSLSIASRNRSRKEEIYVKCVDDALRASKNLGQINAISDFINDVTT